jgi:hypothetical protein
MTQLTIRNGAMVSRGHRQDFGYPDPPYASAKLKSLFELTDVSCATRLPGRNRCRLLLLSRMIFDGDVGAAVQDLRQIPHQLSEIGQRRPHGAFQLQCGQPVRPTGWLSEIYLIDDTEPGRRDDIRQTVFPTSSAMSNPPVRSTAKPTGLPRA